MNGNLINLNIYQGNDINTVIYNIVWDEKIYIPVFTGDTTKYGIFLQKMNDLSKILKKWNLFWSQRKSKLCPKAKTSKKNAKLKASFEIDKMFKYVNIRRQKILESFPEI